MLSTIEEHAALDEPYFFEIAGTARADVDFPTVFGRFRTLLDQHKCRVEAIQVGRRTLWLRVRIPAKETRAVLNAVKGEPLVARILTSTAAIAVAHTEATEAFLPQDSVAPEKLRGLRAKRRGLEPRLDLPHTNEIIVKYLDGFDDSVEKRLGTVGRVATLHQTVRAESVRALPTKRGSIEVVKLPEGADVAAALSAYAASEDVDYAEPNYVGKAQLTSPNDLHMDQTDLVRVKAREAWDYRTDSGNLVIAVLDSGLQLNHPDLVDNLWSNPGESVDGVDSDGNGYVDDIHGINAVSGSGNPTYTTSSHGTQVAGVLGARGNNSSGIAGVNWQTKILAVNIYDPQSNPTVAGAVEGIAYAIAKGASVVNASWTFDGFSQSLSDAVDDLNAAGIPLVCAAKNSSEYLDTNASYPSWHLGNQLITVTSSDDSTPEAIPSNAQKGLWMVDVAAPGVGVYTTNVGSYTYGHGTSMAASMVSGTYALLKAHFAQESYLDVLDRIRFSVDTLPSNPLIAMRGRINMQKAFGERPRFANLSTRCYVKTGSEIAIAGIVVTGSSSRLVVFRSMNLGQFGVSNPLANPKLVLFNGAGSYVTENDDWGSLSQSDKNTLQDTGTTPPGASDAAIVVSLDPGIYSVHLSGVNGTQGNGIVEAFNVGAGDSSRLFNVSTRCWVGTGNNIAIAGISIQGPTKRRVLIRALGPSLGPVFGLSGEMSDTKLELFNSSGQSMGSNDDWVSTGAAGGRVSASGYAPFHAKESVLVATLDPGNYTVHLSGPGGATGLGIVEVYEF